MYKMQEQLLETIINQYIKTAQPVGSKIISESRIFNLSPATIRNEMAELENQGFIYQPHTSAGRVPTETGYHYYVKNLVKLTTLDKKTQKNLTDILKVKASLKDLAKLEEFAALAKKDTFLGGEEPAESEEEDDPGTALADTADQEIIETRSE